MLKYTKHNIPLNLETVTSLIKYTRKQYESSINNKLKDNPKLYQIELRMSHSKKYYSGTTYVPYMYHICTQLYPIILQEYDECTRL